MKKTISIVVIIAIIAVRAIGIGVLIDSRDKEESSTKEKKETKSSAEVAGTYVGQYTKFVGDPDSARNEDEEFSLVLEEDGTGKHNRDDMSFNITWKLDGEEFKMTETFIGDPIEYVGTLKDDKLDIFNGDPQSAFSYEYVYEKE